MRPVAGMSLATSPIVLDMVLNDLAYLYQRLIDHSILSWVLPSGVAEGCVKFSLQVFLHIYRPPTKQGAKVTQVTSAEDKLLQAEADSIHHIM